MTKIRPTLIDGFIYIGIDGRVAKRYPYLHFYSRDAAGMMIERKKKKGPISKEKTNTHSKKPPRFIKLSHLFGSPWSYKMFK